MATIVTLNGNLVADPELRFTGKGDAVANMTIAVNERIRQDGEWTDGEPSYYDVTVWRKLAEAVVEQVGKGSGVIVVGKMRIEAFEGKDGTKRRKPVVTADDIAVRIKPARNSERVSEQASDGWAGEDVPPF